MKQLLTLLAAFAVAASSLPVHAASHAGAADKMDKKADKMEKKMDKMEKKGDMMKKDGMAKDKMEKMDKMEKK